MATIINNPPVDNSGGPMGMIILIIILLALGYFGYMYGVPALRQMKSSSPQINVPSEIDVNIKQDNQ